MSQIECKNMSIGYVNKTILRNLNFEINQGEYIFILGDNGVGKTTLLKTLLGLIPPLKGDIIYDQSVKKTSIGYIPQKSKIQQEFPASVYEIVISGCVNNLKWKPFYTKKDKEQVATAMKLLNITHLAKRPFRELSGGQQQRVLLARAFCATDKILVLDEPFVGLDNYSTKQLQKSLTRINKELGVTIVIVSHYVEESLKMCNKVIVLSEDNTYTCLPNEYLSGTLGNEVTEDVK